MRRLGCVLASCYSRSAATHCVVLFEVFGAVLRWFVLCCCLWCRALRCRVCRMSLCRVVMCCALLLLGAVPPCPPPPPSGTCLSYCCSVYCFLHCAAVYCVSLLVLYVVLCCDVPAGLCLAVLCIGLLCCWFRHLLSCIIVWCAVAFGALRCIPVPCRWVRCFLVQPRLACGAALSCDGILPC